MQPSPSAQPSAPISVQSLASGSSGNAYLITAGDERLLVDCGVGIREIETALIMTGATVHDLVGTLVSHEHTDHVRSLTSLARRPLPLLMTSGTAGATGVGAHRATLLSPGEPAELAGFRVTAIPTQHDAEQPCGFQIEAAGFCVSILTDMGCVADETVAAVDRSDLLVVEANHDTEMLRNGPYPAHLKRRIAGDLGHLSNRQCVELLSDGLRPGSGPNTIWLAHLSATNNRPSVALDALKAIHARKLKGRKLAALPRHRPGPIWAPTQRARQLALVLE